MQRDQGLAGNFNCQTPHLVSSMCLQDNVQFQTSRVASSRDGSGSSESKPR
jgi:hypothetical protein